jgi:hypothetical protein
MTPVTEAKLTYGFWGIVGGAAIAMIIGFNWGGWTTAGTTQKMKEDAVLASRAAICVAQFMNAPNHELYVKEFQGTDSYKRSDLIEKGGWDRMPGQEKAVYGVASACVTGLEALIKTGA